MSTRFLALLVLPLAAACGDDSPSLFFASDTPTMLDSSDDVGETAPDVGDASPSDAGDVGGHDTEADADADDSDAGEPDTPIEDTPTEDSPELDAPGEDASEPDVEEPDAFPERFCGDDFFDGQAHTNPDAPADSPDGGYRETSPYPASYDSGIEAVIAFAPLDEDPADEIWPEPVEIELPIVEATVYATAPNTDEFLGAQRSFWIHDGRAAIQVFLDDEALDSSPDFDIEVGQRISFTATLVGRFRGVPQIYAGERWSEESSGNGVAFWEIGDEPIAFSDAPRNVRMTGHLVADLGACGGASRCYEFEWESQSITFRTASSWVGVGDCVAWAGPIGTFGGLPQLDTSNFSWFFGYDE